jgi:hypothetical protein
MRHALVGRQQAFRCRPPTEPAATLLRLAALLPPLRHTAH